jgi:hypothetical protein
MVWPILISVAVTPRISADGAAAGQLSNASALTKPSLVTKRIDTLPVLFLFGGGGRGLVRALATFQRMTCG